MGVSEVNTPSPFSALGLEAAPRAGEGVRQGARRLRRLSGTSGQPDRRTAAGTPEKKGTAHSEPPLRSKCYLMIYQRYVRGFTGVLFL